MRILSQTAAVKAQKRLHRPPPCSGLAAPQTLAVQKDYKMAARRTAIVFGANTEVGKTLCSAALIRAGLRRFGRAAYLKPLQTGVDEAHAGDAALVKRYNADGLGRCDTLHAWRAYASPHVAARQEGGKIPSDAELARAVADWLSEGDEPFGVVETAGGCLSPTATGRPQADAYAGLDAPALLVGDARLGGISCSLCAWEALVRRGFDVRSIIFVGDDAALGNAEAVRAATGLGDGVVATNAPPPLPEPLDGWLAETEECFDAVCASVL